MAEIKLKKKPDLGAVSDRAPKKAAPTNPTRAKSSPSTPLVRKEYQGREDQSEALARIRRRLNHERRAGKQPGQSVTDTMLVRIAIDLLISREDDLHGFTEEDLLKSLIQD